MSIVSDEPVGEWTAARDLVLPIFGSSTRTRGRLDEVYDRSRLWRDPVTGAITALIRTDGTEIALSFAPTIQPVDFGVVRVGEEATQRMYALPVGSVEGRIALKGEEPEDMEGTAVFQRAWGDSPDPERVGSLFSAHLGDGSVVTTHHGPEPESVHAFSLAMPDGRTMVTDAFAAEPSEWIAAPSEDISYPVEWRLRTTPGAPEPSADLRFETTTGGQPVRVLVVPFWVGRCTVSGTVSDAPAQGLGYVLLRGEPDTASARE